MARPKKLGDADAVRLVDSLYEQCGDHSRLKFSELEKHAAILGMEVKAYDLRRNEAVLTRIAEIEAFEMNTYSLDVLAYKGLDIDGFISSNRTQDKLKRSLSELDGRWRKLFDHAVRLSKQIDGLSGKLEKAETLSSELKEQNKELSGQAASGHSAVAALKAENAYLRKKIKEYLYPSLADNILKTEHADGDQVATRAAIINMVDRHVPLPFSMSVAPDVKMRSLEDALIDRLKLEAMEDD